MRRAAALVAAVVVATLGVAGPAHAARSRSTVEFRPVLAQVAPELAAATTTAPVDLTAAKAAVASCDVAAVAQLAVVPTTSPRAATRTACVVFPDKPGGRRAPRYYLDPAGDFPVDDAKAEFVPGQGWTVKVDFTKAGAQAWDRMAREQFHQQVAITYDGIVVSAPTIQPSDAEFTSFGGVAVISGDFTQKEAIALAAAARLADVR